MLRPRKVKGPLTQYKQVLNQAYFSNTYTDPNTGITTQLKKQNKKDVPFVFLMDYLKNGNDQCVLPYEESKTDFSFKSNNLVLEFKEEQYQRTSVSSDNPTDGPLPPFSDITYRIPFVTCVIDTDVPLIRNKIANTSVGTYCFAELIQEEINPELKTVIRANAIFPDPLSGNYYGKLCDASVLDGIDGYVTVDNSAILDQLLQYILTGKPIYEINLDVDFGVINLGYEVGGVINNIIGSQLKDGTGGYYNLNCVIEKYEIMAIGDDVDEFTSKVTCRNYLGSTRKEHRRREKMIEGRDL
jgi:hypothetical protein